MADGTPRSEFVAEQLADRLYIIDARNRIERQILLDWIHATSVDPGGEGAPMWVSLAIADDGLGFDPDQPHQGFGLRGMRDRLAAVGGRLEVASTPDGTRLVAHVPLGGDATPGEAPAEQPAPTEEDR